MGEWPDPVSSTAPVLTVKGIAAMGRGSCFVRCALRGPHTSVFMSYQLLLF